MITREGNKLILTLPDEQKAEVLEWILTTLLNPHLDSPSPPQSSAPIAPALHQSPRSDASLRALEESREIAIFRQQAKRSAPLRYREGLMPFVTIPSGNPRDLKK